MCQISLVILFRRLRQEDYCEFDTSLGYLVSSWLAWATEYGSVPKQNELGQIGYAYNLPIWKGDQKFNQGHPLSATQPVLRAT